MVTVHLQVGDDRKDVKRDYGGDLAAAVAAADQGDLLWLQSGVYTAEEIEVATAGVRIVGPSMGGSPFAGGAVIEPSGDFGLRFSGPHSGLADVRVGGANASGFTGHAVELVSDYFNVVRDVWFHQVGKDYAGSADLDNAPACVWIEGTTVFSDWHKLTRLHIWNPYRGVVMSGSANFTWSDSAVRGAAAESLYIRRKNFTGGADGSSSVSQVWMAHDGVGLSEYMVFMDWDPAFANNNTGVTLMGCTTEQATSTDGMHHIYCNLSDVQFIGHRFIGGRLDGSNPSAVHFGDDAAGCVVGPHVALGQAGKTKPVFTGTAQSVWQPSDYTG